MPLSRREFIHSSVASAAAFLAPPVSNNVRDATSPGTITPEMFGAKGDGKTNDTAALAAMAAHVNALGGGTILFRRTTYVVGAQKQAFGNRATYAFEPAKIMEFVGCSKPLVIQGNGARIKCAPGLRLGTFNPASGAATRHKMPYFGEGELANPYRWMIKVERSAGPVEISDLELDGNLNELTIGGPWGDTGHQLGCFGLGLYNNSGQEIVRNLHTHHHGVDGIVIDGVDRERAAPSMLTAVRSEYNGRQGCSIVGGRGYRFADCQFNHTGKAGLASAPGAGVDIEAEHKKIRDLAFANCEFSDNYGPGLVADQGDSENARFTGCTFVGTSSWAAWPCMPRFRFDGCNFVGPIANAFGDASHPDRATQFFDCSFRDDPALSPTGKVYVGQNSDGPIADLPNHPNVLFSRCSFLLTHAHALPWTTKVIFSNCVMSQRSSRTGYPRGTYLGTNRIDGKVDLSGATVIGALVVNGAQVPPTRHP